MSHGVEVELPHDERDPFVKRIAFGVAVYAVILAVAGAGGKHASKDMISEQILASNSWAQYQAKVVREAIYTSDLEKYQYEKAKGGLTPEAEAQLAQSSRRVQQKIEQYKAEKEEIRAEAEGHQHARHKAHTRDIYFDFAELFLQIALVLASVAMLAKARWAFLASVALVAVGVLLTVNGYTLALHIGFMEGH